MRSGPTTLNDHLAQFYEDYPFSRPLGRIVRDGGASIVYASQVLRDAPRGSWVLHVKLSSQLSDHFGISRQFAVYCMRTADLQPRDVTRLRRLIADAAHPIETDVAMIVTSDPRAPEKLKDWSVERSTGVIVIPVVSARLDELVRLGLTESALQRLISKWISTYNLYDQREPVTGDRFFGRGDLLRELDRKLAHGAGHAGLFGLRRIGKTSVLLELKDRLRKRADVVPLFVDLERSPTVPHVAYRLGEELAKVIAARSTLSERAALRALNVPDEWASVSPTVLLANLGDSLRNLLESGVLSGCRLILILDEAEILLPSSAEPKEHAIDFFRVLRGVAQETQKLTLVMAGVNATPSESPHLGGDDNPLFGLLSVEYLGPLEPEECREMVRLVGRKMQIRWDDAPLKTLAKSVGSHPLLARLLASDVISVPEAPSRPNIGHVEEALKDFAIRNGPIFEQMVQSLRRYYPDEFELLKMIAAGDEGFAREYASAQPSTLNHLVGYGVVDRLSLRLAIPVFAEWLALELAH